jgi:hypothetical protein
LEPVQELKLEPSHQSHVEVLKAVAPLLLVIPETLSISGSFLLDDIHFRFINNNERGNKAVAFQNKSLLKDPTRGKHVPIPVLYYTFTISNFTIIL